jgi:ubiquinone biosynthesis monooxygenase Coq7
MNERVTPPRVTAEDRLPGDPTKDELIERIVRVDHAGEYGAVRIYRGQLAVLGRSHAAPVVREMAETEVEHLAAFERLVGDRRVRPTALLPIWHAAGFALGAATALLGERAAMACTAAVEEVIDEHYRGQIATLGEDEADLRAALERYRADEAAHRDTALAHEAEKAPAYELLSGAIKAGSRLAIWLSTRI